MKTILKTLVMLWLPVSLAAQLTPVTEQYVLNPFLLNPAYAGNTGVLNLASFYRTQWVGLEGAPETTTFTADAPFLRDKLGLGLIVVHDRVGVTNETQFLTNYAFKIDLGQGRLSFGLGAGITTTNTAWSKLVALDEGDDLYLIDSRVFVVPNFTFGMYYSNRNYFAGFSVPKLANYTFDYDKNSYTLDNDLSLYSYMFTTGYTFSLSENVKLMPSTLLTYYTGETFLYDLNLYSSFFNRFWTGITYRNDRSLTGLIQFHLSEQLKLAYSYDFDIGDLSRYSNGTHGVMLRYEFKYKVDVVGPVGI